MAGRHRAPQRAHLIPSIALAGAVVTGALLTSAMATPATALAATPTTTAAVVPANFTLPLLDKGPHFRAPHIPPRVHRTEVRHDVWWKLAHDKHHHKDNRRGGHDDGRDGHRDNNRGGKHCR